MRPVFFVQRLSFKEDTVKNHSAGFDFRPICVPVLVHISGDAVPLIDRFCTVHNSDRLY